MSLDLTEFLLARVDEDEQAADLDEQIGHVSRQGYARVLAECESKRRIMERRAGIGIPADAKCPPGEGFTWIDGAHAAARNERERTFRLLALPYADHPDFREEWRA